MAKEYSPVTDSGLSFQKTHSEPFTLYFISNFIKVDLVWNKTLYFSTTNNKCEILSIFIRSIVELFCFFWNCVKPSALYSMNGPHRNSVFDCSLSCASSCAEVTVPGVFQRSVPLFLSAIFWSVVTSPKNVTLCSLLCGGGRQWWSNNKPKWILIIIS